MSTIRRSGFVASRGSPAAPRPRAAPPTARPARRARIGAAELAARPIAGLQVSVATLQRALRTADTIQNIGSRSLFFPRQISQGLISKPCGEKITDLRHGLRLIKSTKSENLNKSSNTTRKRKVFFLNFLIEKKRFLRLTFAGFSWFRLDVRPPTSKKAATI